MALDLVSIAQPHYIPGYTGHCPEYKYRIGDTYGSTTHKILLDPSVQHSERLVLSDRTADDFQIFRPPQTDIDTVNARFRNGDPIYKHPMIPGYEGFLPRLNAQFGQRYTVAATESLSEFQRLQLNQRAARHQLERVVDLQAGKGQPWDLVDRFSATAEFKLPLVVVRPECAGILRDLPMDEPKLSPATHSVSPYFMENSDPDKYIKKGFTGHVPYGFQRFGESSKKLTNSALCDFSSNYRRRQSTEWAPVNVVKKAGMQCSTLCKYCKGSECTIVPPIEYVEECGDDLDDAIAHVCDDSDDAIGEKFDVSPGIQMGINLPNDINARGDLEVDIDTPGPSKKTRRLT